MQLQSILKEAKELLKIALPAALANFVLFGADTTDSIFIGHLGNDVYLAAHTLYLNYSSIAYFACFSPLYAIDILVPQAIGSGQRGVLARALKTATVIAIFQGILCTIAWIFASSFWRLLRVTNDPSLLHWLQYESLINSIAAVPLFLFRSSQKWLDTQGLPSVSMYIGIGALIVNVALNPLFIYGMKVGFLGSPTATVCSRFFLSICVLVYIIIYYPKKHGSVINGINENDNENDNENLVNQHKSKKDDEVELLPQQTSAASGKGTNKWREALSLPILLNFLRLGIPSGMIIFCEVLGFESLSLQISFFKNETLMAAQGVLFTMLIICFLLPFGISIGTSVRVGQFVGANNFSAARRAARVSLLVTTLVCTMTALCLILFRNQLPIIFTSSKEVQKIVSSTLPSVALLHLFDGLQASAMGILRGSGRPSIGAAAAIGGYLFLAVPISILFGFQFRMSIIGCYLGFACGVGVLALGLHVYINTRLKFKNVYEKVGQEEEREEEDDSVEMEVKLDEEDA